MARRPTPQGIFEALLANHERDIAEAFARAVDGLRNAVELQRVVVALEAENIAAAIAALHLDATAYGPLLDAVEAAYRGGGDWAADAMPAQTEDGGRLVFRFDGRNPRAEGWMRAHSSALVTRVLDDQRVALRNVLTAGLIRGDGPRTVALDAVGRINRATGKREGGVLGLTTPQSAYLEAARGELASTDPEALRNYLQRGRRDQRFDRTVLKALKTGTAIPADVQERAAQAYSNRLLALRGEMIARHEAIEALHAGQNEAFEQAIQSGKVARHAVRGVWRSAGDSRVRHTHQVLSGETRGQGKAFVSPSGAQLRWPGDTGLGAPGSETVGCRCWLQKRIDHLANIR